MLEKFLTLDPAAKLIVTQSIVVIVILLTMGSIYVVHLLRSSIHKPFLPPEQKPYKWRTSRPLVPGQSVRDLAKKKGKL